jgi:hypothetical protein
MKKRGEEKKKKKEEEGGGRREDVAKVAKRARLMEYDGLGRSGMA